MWIYGKLKFDFEEMKIYNNESNIPGASLMTVNGLIMLDRYNISYPDSVFDDAYSNQLLQAAYEYYLMEKHILRGVSND